MSPLDTTGLLGTQLLSVLPSLAGWTALVVVAVLLKTRGGGSPATFLLVGGCLLLGATLLRIPTQLILPLLIQRGWSAPDAGATMMAVGLGIELITLCGIIFLIFACWRQFGTAAKA